MATNTTGEDAKSFGNVLLIDPNLVNTNQTMINGIPQYQDMFIFAELVAKSRGRTVIETNNSGLYTLSNDSSQKDIVINFMGNNQDSSQSNPNYLRFTTNWYDGSTGDRQQTEGFGISSIKVLVNSSFIPQVNIQFIDLRGLAFFNQNNSPYRILFNFPPPIFYLTLKGYYGKPLTYQLHLVKYTTEFKAENGNFIIDAQFIAMTYAPLTDVLFRYVVNFPLIVDPISANPAPQEPPRNTYELILKLKNLYSEWNTKQKTLADIQTYNNLLTKLTNINNIFITLSAYKNDERLIDVGVPYLFIGRLNTASSDMILTNIQSIADYDAIIKNTSSDGIVGNPVDRLMIGYLDSANIPTALNPVPIPSSFYQGVTPTSRKLQALENYKTYLISTANNTISTTLRPSDMPVPKSYNSNPSNNFGTLNVGTANAINTYVCLDITNYYRTLYNTKVDFLKQKTVLMGEINEVINNLVLQNLGMRPTIYNIFKIILDDVDRFFNILAQTSYEAEKNHHKNYSAQILDGNFKDVINTADVNSTKIFAFPLIVKQQKICNQTKETRIAPIELSQKLPQPFPEIELIQKFINSFITQRNLTTLYDMKSVQNADGTYAWIPVSPFDSVLGTPTNRSPYFGVDTSGGGSTTQNINLSNNPRLTQILTIILKRFYILSQNSLPYKFYEQKEGTNYIKYFSESEAINLVASIFNQDYVNLLSEAAQHYQTNVGDFYTYIRNNILPLYSFTEEEHPFFSILHPETIDTIKPNYIEGDAYVNKSNPNYNGFTLYPGQISVQSPATTTTTITVNNPVQNFLKVAKQSNWNRFWTGVNLQGFLKFTNENVFFINDGGGSSGTDTGYDVFNTKTRFLTASNYLDITNKDMGYAQYEILYTGKGGINQTNRINFIKQINQNSNGNAAFNNGLISDEAKNLNLFTNIIDVWVDQLSKHDTEIYDTIIDNNNISGKFNPQLSALVLLSNFGYTLSTFNIYPNDLNQRLFSIPAVIQVPQYLPYYMGALVGIKPGDAFYNIIYDFFVNGDGKNLNSSGTFIFADIIDINIQLASADMKSFKDEYTTRFYDNGTYNDIIANLNNLYTTVKNDPTVISADDKVAAKEKVYRKLLNTDNPFYINILQPLMNRNNIVNFSQITFQRNAEPHTGYDSISTTNGGTKKSFNDSYFSQFFANLYREISLKKNQIKKQKEEDDKLSGDEDIITQTYYSFKNINDKWLASPKRLNMGYPFNEDTNNLIDLFAFVDRAMNPIGDTIINPEILIQMLDDQNVSVFTVLTQMLSMNGFEFFPLQNFMKYTNDDWKSSFLIDTNGTVNSKPAFVCMYIGGSSSYPSGIQTYGGQYKDDAIIDISNPADGGGKDFTVQDCYPVATDDNQKYRKPDFPWGQVRAFRVKFGVQNQSMFTDIKIDSKEYPETNESIQILSRLAGDNKLQAPTPKGQNLYNLYENRSYKATIKGLGNMMIQPTQYFQVENVPLFNGAFIILSVEHNIEPNRMTTSFSGTKILKYPVPRVLQPSSILGFDGGNTDDTNPYTASENSVTIGPQASADQSQAQYNSMYDFKIR
jgi:hypothetical protein